MVYAIVCTAAHLGVHVQLSAIIGETPLLGQAVRPNVRPSAASLPRSVCNSKAHCTGFDTVRCQADPKSRVAISRRGSKVVVLLGKVNDRGNTAAWPKLPFASHLPPGPRATQQILPSLSLSHALPREHTLFGVPWMEVPRQFEIVHSQRLRIHCDRSIATLIYEQHRQSVLVPHGHSRHRLSPLGA